MNRICLSLYCFFLFLYFSCLTLFSLSRRSFYNYSRKISGRLLSLLRFNLFDYLCLSLSSIVGKYFFHLRCRLTNQGRQFVYTHRMTAGSVYIYLYLLSLLFGGKPTKKVPCFYVSRNITLVHVVVNFIFIKNMTRPPCKKSCNGVPLVLEVVILAEKRSATSLLFKTKNLIKCEVTQKNT